MLKDLLDGTCRVVPMQIEWKALEGSSNPGEEVKLIAEDSVAWERKDDCISIKCTRKAGFDPECNFEVIVSYVVEHFLLEQHSLDALSDEEIDKEVREQVRFYVQENQGLLGRVSMIIAQLTSAFGAPPLVLPPSYKLEN